MHTKKSSSYLQDALNKEKKMNNLEKYKEEIRKIIVEEGCDLSCAIAMIRGELCDTTGADCTACELNSLDWLEQEAGND